MLVCDSAVQFFRAGTLFSAAVWCCLSSHTQLVSCCWGAAAALCKGTGKTSTIVHAIRALVASGASVLVAAYTNSALDNILTKLADSGVHHFLRLGRPSSCHARVLEYMPGGKRWVCSITVGATYRWLLGCS